MVNNVLTFNGVTIQMVARYGKRVSYAAFPFLKNLENFKLQDFLAAQTKSNSTKLESFTDAIRVLEGELEKHLAAGLR